MSIRGQLAGIAALARANVIAERPDRPWRASLAAWPWGQSLVGGLAFATARYPCAVAIADDDGDVTYRDLWRTSDALAHDLKSRSIGPDATVGVLAHNDRRFITAVLAASKLGAKVVYLNAAFAPPQLADVCTSEQISTVLHDSDLGALVADAGLGAHGLEIASAPARCHLLPLLPPRRRARSVLLTSGTTGRPKGAARASGPSLDWVAPILWTVPMRARDTVVIAPPLFHGLGLGPAAVALGLSSTVVLQRRFDAEATLAAIARHRASGLVLVPVMLQRILALGGETIVRHDTSSLRYIVVGGSALGASLATAATSRFGPILYNAYGSTEVGLASVATPRDLRAEPATVGRPAPGVDVRILDDDGAPVPAPLVGRIFVGGGTHFDGYTGGGGKEVIDEFMATGDVGHVDPAGRLFIDGRDDEMIVSGGENVFPAEVEDLLQSHPSITEAAVIGVDDDEFGQRLKAFVVAVPGRPLDEAAVQAFVRANLARYKVPRDVEFVPSLPRTPTGKVRKRALS